MSKFESAAAAAERLISEDWMAQSDTERAVKESPETTAKKNRFRRRFKKLVGPRTALAALAEETGVELRTLERWYDEGVSEPNKNAIDAIIDHFELEEGVDHFFDPPKIKAPPTMHEALDDAVSGKYRDFVQMVVMWAQTHRD